MECVSISFPIYHLSHSIHEAHDFYSKLGNMSPKYAVLDTSTSRLLQNCTKTSTYRSGAWDSIFPYKKEFIPTFHPIKGTISSATFLLWSLSHVIADNQRSLFKHYFIKLHDHQCCIFKHLCFYRQKKKSFENTQDWDCKKGYEIQTHEARMSACMNYHKVLENAIIVHTSSFFP